jgi:hypothetical protein
MRRQYVDPHACGLGMRATGRQQQSPLTLTTHDVPPASALHDDLAIRVSTAKHFQSRAE